jgi:monoterpene epsilon-lactone hydrolase
MKGALEKFAARIRENMRKRADGDIDVAGMRAAFERMGSIAQLAPGTTVERPEGFRGERLVPEAHDEGRALVYFHGGVFVLGSAAVSRALVSHIARACRAVAWIVDYRLAPEHPWPAAHDDAFEAWRAITSDTKRPPAMIGDSVGANLVLATMVRARDEGLPLPSSAVFLSPMIDLDLTGASMATNAERDPMVRRGDSAAYAKLYCKGISPGDARVSPLHADMHGLPPTYVQVGKDECLLDDSKRFLEKARAAGVDVTLDVFENVFHVWHFFAGIAPEADDAIARIGRFVRAH